MDDSSHSDYYFLLRSQLLSLFSISLILLIKMSQHGFMLLPHRMEVSNV